MSTQTPASLVTVTVGFILSCVVAGRVMAEAALPSIPAKADSATVTRPLTLGEAMERALETHPELRLFETRQVQLQSAAEIAAQKPALSAALDVENVGGTGAASAADGAEVTLSLASVLERGGKREARQVLAATHLDAMEMERETARLDLQAEVARRYLDVVRAQAQLRLSVEDVSQRSKTVTAAAQRVQAGATPESTRLTAEAAQARAELAKVRAERETVAAYRRLALLWGERNPAARTLAGELTLLPAVPDFDALANWIERTPELKRFAGESRLREARLQLARSERTPDLTWSVGVRRLEETNDWAAVAGISVPFGVSRRAAPEIRSAQAELDGLAIEKQASELTLYATLAEAHGRYVAGKAEVDQATSEVLPRLKRAEAAAERAYRAGALSYLEWAQVQSETIDVREQQLAAAHDAQRALLEIQRLTGEAFLQTTPGEKDSVP
jgi:cobalt-zinc-cadmium efflux system outer membrane protein